MLCCMTEDDPSLDEAVDKALDRTVEAQNRFDREPIESDRKPARAAFVVRRAEELEILATEDAQGAKRRATGTPEPRE